MGSYNSDPRYRSWKIEVNTAGDPPDAWTSNGLRFASKEEADQYGLDLAMRWTAVRDVRSVPDEEPVNRRIVEGKVEVVQ